MRIRQVDHSIEKRIVTGGIISTEFLAGVRSIYQPDLMAIPFAKTVMQWCLDYHEQYDKAPGRDIQGVFESHSRNGLDPTQAEMISDFLAHISDEFEHAPQFNSAYLLDQTEKRFKSRSLQLLSDDISAVLAQGNPAEAETLLTDYKRVELPTSAGVEPLTDAALIQKAFESVEGDILFKFPGALGKLLGPIVREDLIGILGIEKIGKTWILLEFVMRAVNAKCNVALFGAGDMMEEQYVRRIHTYNSKRSHKHHGAMLSPIIDCLRNQDDTCNKRERTGEGSILETVLVQGKPPEQRKRQFNDAFDHRVCTYCMKEAPTDFFGGVWAERIVVEELTADHAIATGVKTAERSRKRLKMSCHPTGTLTIREADAILDRWEQEDGFVPDIILYDYFDIMAPENTKTLEERHKQNDTWKAARAQAQRRHAAVVSVTQANSAGYGQRSLNAKNFSEDKRKFSHCTKFLFLHQQDAEKREGVMRISTAFVRDDAFSDKQVTVLQNLNIGRPFLGSF